MRRWNSFSVKGNAQLSELAQRDAVRLTPDFSADRHAGIMRSVASVDALRMPEPQRPDRVRSHRYWLVPLAAAASVALITLVGIRFAAHHSAPQNPEMVINPPPAAVPAVDPDAPVLALDQAAERVNTRVKDVVETAMAQQQWAGLDQDVRAATRYLVDQVPLRSAVEGDGSQQGP